MILVMKVFPESLEKELIIKIILKIRIIINLERKVLIINSLEVVHEKILAKLEIIQENLENLKMFLVKKLY